MSKEAIILCKIKLTPLTPKGWYNAEIKIPKSVWINAINKAIHSK